MGYEARQQSYEGQKTAGETSSPVPTIGNVRFLCRDRFSPIILDHLCLILP